MDPIRYGMTASSIHVRDQSMDSEGSILKVGGKGSMFTCKVLVFLTRNGYMNSCCNKPCTVRQGLLQLRLQHSNIENTESRVFRKHKTTVNTEYREEALIIATETTMRNFKGTALTVFGAGNALKTEGSFVNGAPLRGGAAGRT